MLSDGVYSDYDVDIRKRLLHEDDVEVLNLSMDS